MASLFGGCYLLADFYPFLLIYDPFVLADGHHYPLSYLHLGELWQEEHLVS